MVCVADDPNGSSISIRGIEDADERDDKRSRKSTTMDISGLFTKILLMKTCTMLVHKGISVYIEKEEERGVLPR